MYSWNRIAIIVQWHMTLTTNAPLISILSFLAIWLGSKFTSSKKKGLAVPAFEAVGKPSTVPRTKPEPRTTLMRASRREEVAERQVLLLSWAGKMGPTKALAGESSERATAAANFMVTNYWIMTHNKEIFLIGKKKSDGFLDMEYRFNDAAGRQTSNNCDDDFPLSPPVLCSAHPALALPPARPELLPLSPKILHTTQSLSSSTHQRREIRHAAGIAHGGSPITRWTKDWVSMPMRFVVVARWG